ncbi:MAG: Ribosomal protein L11 methyltransferase [Verrucomicrobia subdivision 3 bacterium]|nr:Ribosomal protein L11 methyltransferase [Limisphaerales bacterium]MCS1414960.1 Ribosomal protein L11 methyltransferase [Limisphaerales bacterium]
MTRGSIDQLLSMAAPQPPLRQVAITTSLEAEEAVAGLLEALFETTPSTSIRQGSHEAVISVFTPAERDNATDLKRKIREQLAYFEICGLDVGDATIQIQQVKPQDWSESWKRHFHPIEINDRLLIKPPWSRKRAKGHQAVVILNPGMSFGTGNHPTTLFCLQQIAAIIDASETPSCLDIGTGSGILAIAAAKLGYTPISAFDNDPQAVGTARANAACNNVSGQIDIAQASLEDLTPQSNQQYSAVCANLTHDLLKKYHEPITAQLAPRGRLILAGILTSQFSAVRACFESRGLKLVNSEELNEWKSASFKQS